MTTSAQSRRARDLIAEAVAMLGQAKVNNPRLDAELMLAAAAGLSRVVAVIGAELIDEAAEARYAGMVRRRTMYEPLAYILGHKEFYSLELEVTEAVLIPRPETETIVAAALELLATRPRARVLDLGTGSGAIALAIAVNAPHATIVATDLSGAALRVAANNATRLDCHDRVIFREGDLFEAHDGAPDLGRFDLIVANPPYIATAELRTLEPEVAEWEPPIALDGGPDGLACYRRIAQGLNAHLVSDGIACFEVGAGQAPAVSAIFRDAGFAILALRPDASGIARALSVGDKSS